MKDSLPEVTLFLTVHSTCVMIAGSADDSEANQPDQERRQGALRRGVEGQVARGERRRQNLFHHRGAELVPRDGALPDSAAQT